MGFREFFISIGLVGLFLFVMLNFVYNTQNDNNSNDTILNDATLNASFSSLNKNLSDVYTKGKSQKDNFESETPTLGTDSLLFFSIIATGKAFTSGLFGIFNLVLGTMASYLGVPAVVLGVILGLASFTVIILLWSLYKTGG